MTDHHTSLDEDVARGLHHLSAVLAALVAGSAQACRLVADAPRVLEVLCDCVDSTMGIMEARCVCGVGWGGGAAEYMGVLEVLCDCVDITGTLIALLLPSSTSPSPIMGH